MIETTQENWQQMCPDSENTYELRVRPQEVGDFFRITSQHQDVSPYTQHIKGKGKGKSGPPRTSPSTYSARGAAHTSAREHSRKHAREHFERDYIPEYVRGTDRGYAREPVRERTRETSRDTVRERSRGHDRAAAQEYDRESAKEPISEHAVEAARALLREHAREQARERECVPIRDRLSTYASTTSRDPVHDPRDFHHPQDARDICSGGWTMESRRSAYDQYRGEEEADEPPAKHRRMSPPVPSEYGRHELRRSRYDQYDRHDPYIRHQQHDQHDYRCQSRRSTVNEPAVHSSEPHTASHLPASDEAHDLVLRLNNLSDVLFPTSATTPDEHARQFTPRDQQVTTPQRGKGIPDARNLTVPAYRQYGKGTSQFRYPRDHEYRGKSGKSGGKGRGGKESELTVPVTLTVKLHIEDPHKKE